MAGGGGAPSERVPELPPSMFHFVDAANADLVRRDGLLSTNAILQRGCFGVDVEDRARAHRPAGIVLPNGAYVRDQAPMPPTALATCLDAGLTPRDWYDLVNDHVFFWLSAERVRRHRLALRGRTQLLLTVDVKALAAAYADRVYVTPFNIGNARRAPARRGRRTLTPVASWRAHGWRAEAAPGGRERASSHRPAELLVQQGVPDIARFITRVDRIDPE